MCDDPKKAGMSFAHLLACPKERIYNAVSLVGKDKKLIKTMCDSVTEYMNFYDNRERILAMIESKLYPAISSFPNLVTDLQKHIITFLNHTTGANMQYFVHVHPAHTVGHLHIHCLQDNLRTSHLHDSKNTRIEDIMSVLNVAL
jgi:hypothetical protein